MPSDKHNSIMAKDTDLNLLLLDVALSRVVPFGKPPLVEWTHHGLLPLFFFECHFFSLTVHRCWLAVYCPGFLRGFLVKSPGSSVLSALMTQCFVEDIRMALLCPTLKAYGVMRHWVPGSSVACYPHFNSSSWLRSTQGTHQLRAGS